MSTVATAQWRKVPADTPDTAPSGSDLAEGAAGGSVGALVGYLAIVDGIANLRISCGADAGAGPAGPRLGARLDRTSPTSPAVRQGAGGWPSAGSRCSSPATVPSLTGQGRTDAQSVATDLELAGLVLVVLGAIIFRTAAGWDRSRRAS